MASHLTFDERRIVAGLLQRKVGVAQIAIQLGRHRSTIHREIRRNFWHDREVPMATRYWHMNVHHLAAARRSRQRKLIRHQELRLAMIARLKDGWSPEQSAGRLRQEGHRQRVCHETIYSHVYSKDGQALKLGRHLTGLARRMNATPRKCLGFRTPAEVFSAQLARFEAQGEGLICRTRLPLARPMGQSYD